MTNLQRIKNTAKKLGLDFVRTNSKITGAYLYNFVDSRTGNVIASNWTIHSAIDEYHHGDLLAKLS